MVEEGGFRRGVNYRKLSEKYGTLLLLLFLSPLVLLILAIVVAEAPNVRPRKIVLYNERTNQWLDKRISFMNADFFVNGLDMEAKEFASGSYYPVSDTCNRKNDPRNGCIYASSIYHSALLNYTTEVMQISVGSNRNGTLIQDTVPIDTYELLGREALKDISLQEGEVTCTDLGGVWVEHLGVCNVTYHLNRVCYRVVEVQDSYVLDSTTLVHSKRTGCDFSSNWSPYVYSTKPSPFLIPIEIRLNLDPLITASKLTNGCADLFHSNSTSADCFGRTFYDQILIAKVLVMICIVLFFIEACAISMVCRVWVGKKRNISPTRKMSPSYEQIFTPLTYAAYHPLDLPEELAGLGAKGLQERLAVNGTLRVPKPTFTDSVSGPVEILDV